MKKIIFNYFALFIDGLIIEKQENKFKLIIFLLLISIPLAYFSLQKEFCKTSEILNGILTFDSIIIGFLINFLILYVSLGNTKYLKKLKNQEYKLPHNNKKLIVGKKPISIYQYILSKIFFTIGIGLFLALLIFFSYIYCYTNLSIVFNDFVRIFAKFSLSELVIATSLYFIFYTYRLINKFYMLLFVYVKE